MKKFLLPLITLLFTFDFLLSQPYIYIFTNKNILPDEELKVQTSGYNIFSDKITFELFRVKKPIELATSQVDFYNFTDKNFNELLDNFELINSYQKRIKTKQLWFAETYSLDKISEKGTYLIRATIENKSSYTFFTCSDIGIISKRSVDEILVFVANRKTSQPIPNQEFKLISLDKKNYSIKTNKDGVALNRIGNRPEDRKFLIVTNDNDTTLLLQEIIYSPSDEYDKYLVYTYTNQPVYRPKQKVFFKSIIRERKGDELNTAAKFNLRVKVLMPDNSVLFDSNFTTNSFGTINGSFEIPNEAPIGSYSIVIEIDGMNYPTEFFVEEYKKPEYKVTIKTDKDNYTPSDEVEIKVTADYFFGKPVQSGKVKLLLYRKLLIRHWWEFEPFANFYRGCFVDIIPYYRPELLLEEEGELENGEFKFIYKVDKSIEKNYEYQVVAYVKDESNREVQGNQKFLVTKYKVSLTTSPDRYFYTPNSEIILKVITTDFSFKPIKKKFKVIVHRVRYINFAEYYEDIDTLSGETQLDGVGFVSYKASIGGRYSYTVIVEDENKKLTATGDFFVSDKDLKISGHREGLQIIPARDIFNEADELEFLIISAFKDVNVFVTLEQSKVYEYRIIKLDGNSAILKFKTKLPAVAHISAGFYFDNQYLSALKKFGILQNKQKLNIEITADKEVYKPKEKGRFKIKVTDSQGKPVKNVELSSSIIDESIFSIKPEQSKNIFEQITQSSIYKILTTTTELPVFFLNQEYFAQRVTEFKELKKKGNATISGRVLNAFSSEPIYNSEVKLIKDNYQIKAFTNSNGRFIFRNVPEGKYDLIIDIPLYYKKIIPSIVVKAGINLNLSSIYLLPIEAYAPPLFLDEHPLRGEIVFTRQSANGRMMEGMLSKSEAVENQFIEPTIRKDFKDAIFWNANLITDQNGEVRIEVNYPDNLTSWRNSIKAITIDNKAGENFANVIVRKDILIRVETPRYLHEKDEVILPVIIHNYSDKEQKVKVTLDVINGKHITDFDERMNQRIINPELITIKSNDVVKLNYKILVSENVDTLIITAKALVQKTEDKNVESDAVEIKIPVEPIGYPEFVVNNFSLSKTSEKISTKIYVNDEKKNLKVTLKLSPTLIGNILSSIEELVAYPYGCVEQTMSRFLPAIIVTNLIREIKLDIKQKTLDELPKVISEGLKRLKDFQHNDGGWGWWKDDQTNPYMTAYVMYGLSLTKKSGYQVVDKMFFSGLNVLRNLLKSKIDNESLNAYLLYSFNEAIDFSDNPKSDRELLRQKFYELKRVDDNPFIISKLLDIAVRNGFNEQVKILRNKLLKLATVEGNIVYWGGKDFQYGYLISDPIEVTSSAIRALILSGEKSSLIENAIRWLVNQKRGNFWFSTKQTASVIFSLAEFIKSSEELNADFVVRIKLNGKEVKSVKFDKNSLKSGELSFVINSNELKSGLNELEIEKSGKGKLYLSVIENFFKSKYDDEDRHFEVERKFYVVRHERDGEKLIRKISELKDEVKVGERILVELKVKAKNNFEYFMLEDPMLPGFERFNEQFEQNHFERWFYHYKEERDKKTAFFVTNLNKGEYTFSYTTYAQFPGTYILPPSIASLMYYPELRGVGEEKVIKIIE